MKGKKQSFVEALAIDVVLELDLKDDQLAYIQYQLYDAWLDGFEQGLNIDEQMLLEDKR